MITKELEGETLGEKHRDYNRLLNEHVTTNLTLQVINPEDSDVNNLLKIDIANHNKDVEYILNVLKSDDMLYVSRALANSVWLVTDQQYANIINPDYLQSVLYPSMTTKAITKLKKHIRHNIKDEARAEAFYQNESNKIDASKWLPYCSIQFIENNVKNHDMNVHLFKRLCERSLSIFDIIIKDLSFYEKPQYLKAVTFILNTDVDKYLDGVENNNYFYSFQFNHKATELIMRHSPKRVVDKMEVYVSKIHIPTFVKYLKVEEIKAFLNIQINKLEKFSNINTLFHYDNLKHFIRRLPKNEQYDFVKTVCSGDINESLDTAKIIKTCISCNQPSYIWFQFAPFDVAFEEITKLMTQGIDATKKYAMLSLLIKCANGNLKHTQIIIKYFLNKHRNDESSRKKQFVTEILKYTCISKYDDETWNMLNDILISLKVYEAPTCISSSDIEIVNSIIIHNILTAQKIHKIIEKLFLFDTLKSYKNKMTQEQQHKVFDWLYEHLISKVNNTVTDEKVFAESIKTIENMLKLLLDWEKSLLDYPLVINKIKEIVKTKKENSWKEPLSSLYNINKSWRKYMFDESISLHPSDEVCLNALKHEPQLLMRHSDEVSKLRTDDKVYLRQMLAKLRIYWPDSLAQQWINSYLDNINVAKGQTAVVRSLCIMLPQKHLHDIIDKYKPENPTINTKLTQEEVLNVQRFLAKNMHLARPQPTPEAILSYTKGDYLQFALPSLHAIFYNLKAPMNQQYIPKLLDAPVSVQKHGIRLAFNKLDLDHLKKLSLETWQTSKNNSILAIIIKQTFMLLCNEKDNTNAVGLWEILEQFIDNLTFVEDKKIYELLNQAEKVPLIVRAEYLIKSYRFIEKLIPNVKEEDRSQYKWYLNNLLEHSRDVMETISPEFVEAIIQEYVDTLFSKAVCENDSTVIRVFSAYLLCSTNENEQIKKYEKTLVPLMQRSLENWSEKRHGKYYIRQNLQRMLHALLNDVKDYVFEKNKIIPLKIFSLIQIELEKSLSVPENYLLLTKWKITVAVTKLFKELSLKSEKPDKRFGEELGKLCLQYLKNDVTLHFPRIYVLFAKSIKDVLQIMSKSERLGFYESMLSDKDFIQSYLSSIELFTEYTYEKDYDDIKKQLSMHPSVEVKMHYYNKIDKKCF